MGNNIAINLRWRPAKVVAAFGRAMMASPFFACKVVDVIWPSQKYFMNRAAHEKFALGATTLPAAIRMIDEKHATMYLLIDLILLCTVQQ